jgi:hypothetical protein
MFIPVPIVIIVVAIVVWNQWRDECRKNPKPLKNWVRTLK